MVCGGGDALSHYNLTIKYWFPQVVLDKLNGLFRDRKSRPVDINGLKLLNAAEKSHGQALDCIGEFKFAANQEMLTLIEQGRK